MYKKTLGFAKNYLGTIITSVILLVIFSLTVLFTTELDFKRLIEPDMLIINTAIVLFGNLLKISSSFESSIVREAKAEEHQSNLNDIKKIKSNISDSGLHRELSDFCDIENETSKIEKLMEYLEIISERGRVKPVKYVLKQQGHIGIFVNWFKKGKLLTKEDKIEIKTDITVLNTIYQKKRNIVELTEEEKQIYVKYLKELSEIVIEKTNTTLLFSGVTLSASKGLINFNRFGQSIKQNLASSIFGIVIMTMFVAFIFVPRDVTWAILAPFLAALVSLIFSWLMGYITGGQLAEYHMAVVENRLGVLNTFYEMRYKLQQRNERIAKEEKKIEEETA